MLCSNHASLVAPKFTYHFWCERLAFLLKFCFTPHWFWQRDGLCKIQQLCGPHDHQRQQKLQSCFYWVVFQWPRTKNNSYCKNGGSYNLPCLLESCGTVFSLCRRQSGCLKQFGRDTTVLLYRWSCGRIRKAARNKEFKTLNCLNQALSEVECYGRLPLLTAEHFRRWISARKAHQSCSGEDPASLLCRLVWQ